MPAISFTVTQAQFDALDAEAKRNPVGGTTAASYCQGLCERQADSIIQTQRAAKRTSLTDAEVDAAVAKRGA